jgi:ABC-type multidrug transport system ATPase subunit
VTTEAVRIEGLEKLFPPVLSGWKAYVHAFSPLSVPALRNVSFSIAPGEIVAIVGANGAGKSTLLRILTTLLLPTSGRAWVGGADVLREPARVRQQLGFHGGSDASFYARLSARENLRFFAALNNVSRSDAAARIDELAELLHLEAFLDQQVRALSTGTVNRLGLARAMLHRPSILLLDEPTRSLDPFAASELRCFLREEIVGQQGATLLFASHTLSEVAQLADRVALLDAGRLLAFETPPGLLQSTGAQTLEDALDALVRRAGVRQ